MGFSPEYREEVEGRLGALVPVTTRAMFGGVGIYSEGLFFALIAEDRLYFKVDDSNRADFETAGSSPFYPYDSPKPMGYWEVPASVYTNRTELKKWVLKAIKVAESAKKKK